MNAYNVTISMGASYCPVVEAVCAYNKQDAFNYVAYANRHKIDDDREYSRSFNSLASQIESVESQTSQYY